jgi:hypothetical protein
MCRNSAAIRADTPNIIHFSRTRPGGLGRFLFVPVLLKKRAARVKAHGLRRAKLPHPVSVAASASRLNLVLVASALKGRRSREVRWPFVSSLLP